MVLACFWNYMIAAAAASALMKAQEFLGVEMPADEHADQSNAAHDDAGSGTDGHSDEAGGHDD